MKFSAMVKQVLDLLRRQKRISYRALKREFDLDDEYIADLREELIEARRAAADENGRVLVWIGEEPKAATKQDSLESRVQSLEAKDQSPTPNPQPLIPRSEAERRQLTVLFCDLVNYTVLSTQLDPETLREVVNAYQDTCAEVIRRYDGHIAQHLGDGLLVYFGYPTAHEDEAARALHTGLELIEALQEMAPSSSQEESPRYFQPRLFPQEARDLHVRIGIHTGLVVIGEIGRGEKREILALGETPNLAARLQSIAEPDTVVISAATQRLVQGLFECQDLGLQTLKGIPTPQPVYRVMRESETRSRFEATVQTGLTPLVGRVEELTLLQQRWEQVKAGEGQVVLLSGEPGIGKSRLVRELKEQVEQEGATPIEFRCSPYHQNSALYPIIYHLQHLLQFERNDSPATKLEKLQDVLNRYHFPQTDTAPSLASLLSLPHPKGAPPITASPQKQKQKTQEILVAWFIEEAEKAPVYCVWEDLHWADPSTLELLTLFFDQVPTTRVLTVQTFRPEFTPSWGNRSHLNQLTLSRLEHSQVETMVECVRGGKALSPEVVRQIVAKTDGVPLFVEELTKSVLESVGAHGDASDSPLAIPATLQDSLMARLDRLGSAKEIAQLGATIGREFGYELLQAVSPLDEAILQQGLKQLVEAELVYQRGLLPQAHYLFKHALIQDTAYQSLLKSKRQQLHQRIAHVLEERFIDTVQTQPELLAQHYTEAGLIEQAIPYWRRAGERAAQRSAHAEAIAHLTKGLDLLKTLPDIPKRLQQELRLQLALNNPLTTLKGYSSPEVELACTRALELCKQLGETPHLFWVLLTLSSVRCVRAEHQIARELAEQCLQLAQNAHNTTFLVWGHYLMGMVLHCLGEFVLAEEHLEKGITLYNPQTDSPVAANVPQDPKATSLSYAAWALWHLGYPDRARERMKEALALAQELAHPFSLAFALDFAATLSQHRREWDITREKTEAVLTIANEQGFVNWLARGHIKQGWLLAGQGNEGSAQIRLGLAEMRAIGSEHFRPYSLSLLAEAHGKAGQPEEGLNVLAEALALVNKTGERCYEAELYRLKGELLLAQVEKLRD